jgi:hypothetical protein
MSLINPELYEGMKGHGRGGRSLALDEVKSLWALVRDRVRAIGCDLGIWADVPARRSSQVSAGDAHHLERQHM